MSERSLTLDPAQVKAALGMLTAVVGIFGKAIPGMAVLLPILQSDAVVNLIVQLAALAPEKRAMAAAAAHQAAETHAGE